MVDTIQSRYSTGRRQLINRADREQREISEKIRLLRAENSYRTTTRQRSVQIKEEILSLREKYDSISARLRKELRSLEDMRDKEILKKHQGKGRWSF